MTTVNNAGGRPTKNPFQANHTIPEELFTSNTPPRLVDLLNRLQGLPGAPTLLDLDSPQNLQPLPASGSIDTNATHRGSHPGYTESVKERLETAYTRFAQEHGADIAAFDNNTADAATIDRLRTNVAAELRGQIDDIQFRSTNFMDDASSVGNRLVYNRRDLAYLRQTQAWTNATPADRIAAAGGDNEALKRIIRSHNDSVLQGQLSPQRLDEFKVLKDIGGGELAHMNGSTTSRDALRSLISDAQVRGIDLGDIGVDAKNYLQMRLAEINAPIADLNQRIDEAVQRLSTASSSTRSQRLRDVAELMSERTDYFRSQFIGSGVDAMPFDRTIRPLAEGLATPIARGMPMGVMARELLESLAVKLSNPIIGAIDTTLDAFELLSMAHQVGMKFSAGYRNAASELYQYVTGNNLDLAGYIETDEGEATFTELDGLLVVTAKRQGVTETFVVNTIQTFGSIINWTAQGFKNAVLTLTGFGNRPATVAIVMRNDQEQPGAPADYWGVEEIVVETERGAERVLSIEDHTLIAADGSQISVPEPAKLDFQLVDFASLGAIFGSNLARLMDIRNPWQALAAGTALGTIGLNIGQAIDSNSLSLSDAFSNIGDELQAAGIGAVSSYLFGELVSELGLSTDLGAALTSTGGAVISQIATNLASTEGAAALANIDVAFGNAVGSFVGTWLASEVISFDTLGGQLGAALGAAVGGFIGGAIIGAELGGELGSFAGPVGTAIGAFIGYIVGGLIGSMFSGTPRSAAAVGWDPTTQQFIATWSWTRSGANDTAARAMASSAGQVLTAILRMTGATLLDADGIRLGAYGMHDKNFVYRTINSSFNLVTVFKTPNFDDVLNYGVAVAAADMIPRLAGGNVFIKRAIIGTFRTSGLDLATMTASLPNHSTVLASFTAEALMGNLNSALEYSAFVQNAESIGRLMAQDPNSSFSAMWTAVLARAWELGLHKRAETDWIGGWTRFLDEALGDGSDGIAFNPSLIDFLLDIKTQERMIVFYETDGSVAGVLGDTINTGDKDLVSGTAGADVINVATNRIVNATGLTINGAAASSAQFVIDVAAVIDGGAGNDTITGGDLGNDLIGGEGNDTLVGGKLDDWLFGDAGNDRLFAGAANYQFTDGDAVAAAAAVNVVGNGDFLDGGDGDDALYGSRGSDWLRGGDGVDTIHGGAGADIIDGGAGNDSAAGAPRLFGGAGTDQYIFGYNSGVDGIFDDSDNAAPGSSGSDSIHTRLQQIANGTLARNWAGGGDYEADGSVKGGEDAIAFGPGIGMQDLILQRSGQDLTIRLTFEVPENNTRVVTGDQIIIKDWFESTHRVEWLRFASGEEIRIGDIASFIVGTALADTIVGTNESDFMYGGDGNDQMYGLAGDDYGFGGAGKDMVAGDGDNDWVAGGLDDDKVIGGLGNDTAFGDAGADEVYGGLGSDIVAGGLGDDLVVGGAGDDIFRYQRGDGRDVLLDEYVNNWDAVFVNQQYTNGYVLNIQNGTVTKNGQTYFDGTQWLGLYDYDAVSGAFRRHLGTVNGALAANSGSDYLEFGVGIDIQDLMFQQNGSDLQIAVTRGDSDVAAFDTVTDRITIRDWYLTGNAIENFVFVATGRHDVTGWNIRGGGDGANLLSGGSGVDWLTGNGGDDTIYGNDGADILSGNGGNDVVRGGGGNDVIYGGAGEDVLEGGAGADTLVGGSGSDVASYATAGSGVRAVLSAQHTNMGEAAGDTYNSIDGLEGSSGDDWLGGDGGQNTLRGGAGNDSLLGGAGDDIYEISSGDGQDVIEDIPFVTEEVVSASGVFNSAVYEAQWITTSIYDDGEGGQTHAYQLIITRRETGEELYRSWEYQYQYPYAVTAPPPPAEWAYDYWRVVEGMPSQPVVTGNGLQVVRDVFQNAGGGNDAIELDAEVSLADLSFEYIEHADRGTTDLRITYGADQYVTIRGQTDPTRAIETLHLRDGLSVNLTSLILNWWEEGTSGSDFFGGNHFEDDWYGHGGDDVLAGAGSNDRLYGGDGNDILEGGTGADTLDGGNDSVSAGLAPDTAYGDTIRYVTSDAAVQIDLAASSAAGGHATGDVIVAVNGVSTIENIVGSNNHGDTLRGDARANRLFGLGGNDLIEGRGGADVLVGGLGGDTLRGGDGEDNLAGDAGGDTLEGGNDNDLLGGGADNDWLFGDAGEDMLSGGDGDDTLRGGTENDRLGGDAGVDQLYGEAGADQLAGGDGNDFLYGGDGNDSLVGEAGNDQLFGEAGDDTYAFDANSGSDVIVDSAGTNRITLNGVSRDQVWMTRSGNDLRITIIGGTASITVQNYYAASTPTRVREIVLEDHSLFTAYAEPLITSMTAINGGATPAQMPAETIALLDSYWHAGGAAVPTVQTQNLTTNEDTPLSGTTNAIDHDQDIVSYAIDAQPVAGTITINATTGAWTYSPNANVHGPDSFRIVVTDARNNRAVQTVMIDVVSVNDAPSDISLTGTLQIEERDRPPAGTLLTPVVLGTLSATDVDAPDDGDFDDHVFTVSDSRFEIVDGTTLRLRAGAALDFEASPTVAVPITVTDRNGAGLSFTRTFTFTVLDRDDYLYGTPGDDTLTGQAGRNLIYGLAGNDTITGAGANDDLDGGDGTDEILGLGGNDLLLGGLGNDTLDGGAGADVLHGGDGEDTLIGGDGADQLFGEDGFDSLQGGGGDDQLDGGTQNDLLQGDVGADRLVGGDGEDVLIGGSGADRFLGGNGVDIVTYATATAGVTVDVTTTTGSTGDAAGDVFEDVIEHIIGTSFNDTITGGAGDERLEGGAGNDVIYGGAGNDQLFGGDGDDTIDAQSGDDQIDGGAGSDTLRGGNDNDTYLMNVNSGHDLIYNYDPNGLDYDVIGYEGITREQLWFKRVDDDLVISVVGTDVRTTIVNWYGIAQEGDLANYKIDFIIAGERVTATIDAESLVELMAPHPEPETQEEFDELIESPEFNEEWSEAWRDNEPPVVPTIANQTINEDGTVTLTIAITDDFTPAAGLEIAVRAVRPDNHAIDDDTIVSPPTISGPDANGNRTLTVNTRPNASGSVAIVVTATDAGGISTTRDFLLTVNAVADTPVITLAAAATPTAPLTKPTFDQGGSWEINLQAALVDQDGSETLEVRIANVPSAITFNAGSNLGDGVWSFTPAQLPGLRIRGPVGWSQDLALSVTAIAREISNGSTATSAAAPLNIVINATPTDIFSNVSLAFNENTANGTALATLLRSDADAGDTATFTLVNNAGGRFTLSQSGVLSAGSVPLDYESATTQTIRVRVTDSGGLFYEENIDIAVNNVNEAPTLPAYTFNIAETAGLGSLVGTVAATDPDTTYAPYRDFRYQLVGGNTNLFSINQSSGEIFLSGGGLDADTLQNYYVDVQVWDGGAIGSGNGRTSRVTVVATQVNEAPQITSGAVFTINEDKEATDPPPGRPLSTVSGNPARIIATDPEGSALTWSVREDNPNEHDTDVIQINSSGNLTAHQRLNYETNPVYDFYVRATDAQGNYTEQLVTINTDPEDEHPVILGVGGATQPSNWNTWQYAGTINARDPDGEAMTFEILSAYTRVIGQSNPDGAGWINIDQWEGVSSNYISIDGSGNISIYWYMYDGWIQPPFWEHYYYSEWQLNVRVRDADGLVSEPIGIRIDATGSPGAVRQVEVWHPPGYPPVVLDLDGDGIELVSFSESNVHFRLQQNGALSRTGWIGADDAVLALDRDGDGAITYGAEISFVGDLEGAESDLEGLAAFDTDHDGYFDQDDARFAEFRVWRDANQDGVSQSDELQTLAERGITAVGLTRSLTGQTAQGTRDNIITATSEFIRSDGTTGLVGDVELAYEGSSHVTPPPATDGSQPIGDIDRSSDNGAYAAALRDATEFDGVDVPEQNAPASSEFSRVAPATHEGENGAARRRPWRLSDLQGFELADEERIEDTATTGLQQGALHASLDSVVRRRLQMIEAMAAFAPEGASMLELQPRRKVDARTLELLTSVPEVRVM